MAHPLCQLFSDAGLPLCRRLQEMLDEHPSHRTDRRGCGYTQATRHLSTFVNSTPDDNDTLDLELFLDWPRRATEMLSAQLVEAGASGWRELGRGRENLLDALPDSEPSRCFRRLFDLERRSAALPLVPESQILLRLILQILFRRCSDSACLAPMLEKPDIGSCTRAEEFFLEIAHGRIRRGGAINIFVDDAGKPLLVEKMNLGESHSAIAMAPLCIVRIEVPPGSLFALRTLEQAPSRRSTEHGLLMGMEGIIEARFLRLTTLALAPDDRRRTFTAQMEAQDRLGMLSPGSTTLDDLRRVAADECQSSR